jgi:hypothetical protein
LGRQHERGTHVVAAQTCRRGVLFDGPPRHLR